MANNYTPEEIQAVFDEYHRQLAAGAPITKDLAERMQDATKGVKNYTYELNQSLKQLGSSIKVLGKDLANGAQGASAFNDALDSGTDAFSKFLNSFGLVGMALGAVVKAGSAYVGAVNKQSDTLYKTYQDISRAGAIGAGGITQVYANLKQFGYTINQANDLARLIGENSKNFGLFSSSAVSGTKQFGRIADSIQNSDLRVSLFNLGMTVDDINKGLAGYIVQEGKLGKLRGQSDAQVSQGAKAYIREMEILTRLTGVQRQELEDQREAALSIDAFYASLDDLGPEAREQALAAFNQLYSVSKKAGEEFAQNFSGVITGTTDLLLSTGAESMKYTKEFFAQGGKAPEAVQGIGDALARTRDVTKNLAQVGSSFGLSFRDTNMLLGKASDGIQKSYDAMGREVDLAAAGTDAATNAQSKLRNNQINTSQAMQDMVNLGITPVTKAMAYLAEVVENLTSLLPGAKSKGYGQGGTGSRGGSLAATGAGAATGAAAGSLLGPLGTAAGGLIGGIAGYAGYQIHGGEGDSAAGLRIKSGESTAGGETRPGLYALAQKIQNELGSDLRYFSAFNDSFHQGTNSAHARGAALDFTLADPSKAAQVAAIIRGMPGVAKVLDEYTNPSSRATAGHIHAEINGASGFNGSVSGPMSGYRPNILMHGTEQISIKPTAAIADTNSSGGSVMGVEMIEKLDDLITLAKSQLYVNERILKYQQ